jgi:hypothetical protein
MAEALMLYVVLSTEACFQVIKAQRVADQAKIARPASAI